MRLKSIVKNSSRSAKFFALGLAVFAINIIPLITTFYETASAAEAGTENGINMPRNTHYNKGAVPAFQTCIAYFTNENITQSLIEEVLFGDDYSSTDEYGLTNDRLEAMVGRTSPVIKFKPAPTPFSNSRIINGNATTNNSDLCSDTILLQTVNNTWQGQMFTRNTDLGDGPDEDKVASKMKVTLNNPDEGGVNMTTNITYWDIADGNCEELTSTIEEDCTKTSNGFVVQGRPSSTGYSQNIAAGSMRWVDASTIEMSTSNQYAPAYSQKDTYRMISWKGYPTKIGGDREVTWSVYFLDKSDNPARDAINLDSGRYCSNPIATLTDDYHPNNDCSPRAGSVQCVPYLVVTEQINISKRNDVINIDGPSENFKERVNKLGNANTYFFDYNPTNCNYRGHSEARKVQRQERSKVWFYHSAENNAIANVFVTGDGNESQFTGTYNEISREGQRINFEGTRSSCDVRAGVVGTTTIRATSWQFWDGNSCSADSTQPVGIAIVSTITGEEGEAGFATVEGRASAIDVPEASELQEISCVENFVLDWILCPVLNLAIAGSEGLDFIINSLLDVETDRIFDNSADEDSTSNRFHDAWAIFRTFALVLIAAAALIMVIAQAAGLEVLDAYTIRKVLPRLIMASIGITISWELLEFLVTLSNDIGVGIRSIIYAPFADFDFSVGIAGVLASWGIIGGVAVLAPIAFPVILSLLLSGLLGGLIAVLLLVFREVLIIFLVIVSPIAIACAILPNTQKAWSLWRTTLFSMLIVFFMISAFIALGRVFSVVSAGTGIFLTDIISIIAWFAPYFLIPFAFRLAGGVVGRLAGLVNDRSRGTFDRLRNYRQKKVGEQVQKMGVGQGYSGSNRFTRGLNNLTGTVGTAARNPWQATKGLAGAGGADWQNAVAQQTEQNAQQLMDSDNFKRIKNDDDAMYALQYRTQNEARAALKKLGRTDGETEQTLSSIRASGINYGQTAQVAGFMQRVMNGTAISDIADQTQSMKAVAGGNEGLTSAMAGFANSMNKKAGRYDLAPGFGDLKSLAMNPNPTDVDYAQATALAMRKAAGSASLASTATPFAVEGLSKAWETVKDRNQAIASGVAKAQAGGKPFSQAEVTNRVDAIRQQIVAAMEENRLHGSYGRADTREKMDKLRDSMGTEYDTILARVNSDQRQSGVAAVRSMMNDRSGDGTDFGGQPTAGPPGPTP